MLGREQHYGFELTLNLSFICFIPIATFFLEIKLAKQERRANLLPKVATSWKNGIDAALEY